jgi:hypothetical protein
MRKKFAFFNLASDLSLKLLASQGFDDTETDIIISKLSFSSKKRFIEMSNGIENNFTEKLRNSLSSV